MSSVASVVHRVRIGIGRIDTIDIINVSIPIVVDTIPSDFTGVHPHVWTQVWVIVVNPRIKHGNDGLVRTNKCIPSFRQIDIGVDNTTRLSHVVIVPLLWILNVVWNASFLVDDIQFGFLDFWQLIQRINLDDCVLRRSNTDQQCLDKVEALDDLQPLSSKYFVLTCCAHSVVKSHKELIRSETCSRIRASASSSA